METKIDEILKTVNDLKVTNNKIISTISTQNEKKVAYQRRLMNFLKTSLI